MVTQAEELAKQLLPISNDGEALEVRALQEEIHRFTTLVKERRDERLAAFKAAVKQIDGAFKGPLNRLETAMIQVKARLTAWAMEVDARRKAAEDEAERIAAQHNREVAPITQDVIKAQAAAKIVKTREFKEVVVVDPSVLPREYLIPDLVRIRADALAGKAIPGVQVQITKRAVN